MNDVDKIEVECGHYARKVIKDREQLRQWFIESARIDEKETKGIFSRETAQSMRKNNEWKREWQSNQIFLDKALEKAKKLKREYEQMKPSSLAEADEIKIRIERLDNTVIAYSGPKIDVVRRPFEHFNKLDQEATRKEVIQQAREVFGDGTNKHDKKKAVELLLNNGVTHSKTYDTLHGDNDKTRDAKKAWIQRATGKKK